jgi:hypothetical protein
LAALVALAGCVEAPEGNGKRGELDMPIPDMVAGLPVELHLVEENPFARGYEVVQPVAIETVGTSD